MQIIVNVVVLAALYSLICCGYVLIYRVSRVLNLAHGELMALGGYFLFTISAMFSQVPVPAFLVALAMCLVLGLVIYFSLMRFMTGQSVLSAVLVTIALGILLRGLMTLIWTAKTWHPLELLGIRNASFEIMKKRRHLNLRDRCYSGRRTPLPQPLSFAQVHAMGSAHEGCRGEPVTRFPERGRVASVLCNFLGNPGTDRRFCGYGTGVRQLA